MKTRLTIILCAIAAMGACSKPADQNYGDAPAQRPAQQSSSTGDMLMGGFIGYMLGSSASRSTPAPQVVERTTVHTIERQVPVATPVAPLAPAAAPTQKAPVVVAKAPPTVTPAPAPKVSPPAPAVAPKQSYAVQQPYKVTQNAPTYSAPPKPYTPPAAQRSYSSSKK